MAITKIKSFFIADDALEVEKYVFDEMLYTEFCFSHDFVSVEFLIVWL